MKVILYEHVSGGGYAGKPIPAGILAEGYAMLRCAIADFKAAGHEVTILLDTRLAKFAPATGANYTMQVLYPEETKKFLSNAATRNDAIYVIAPETGQTLQTFVQVAEETGKTSLNSKSAAIIEVADKEYLYRSLQKRGVLTPKTLALNMQSSLAEIGQSIKNELRYPVVFKPVDGTGCSGISLVESPADIEKAIEKLKNESTKTHFIIQEFVEGHAASVSLIANSKKAVALSLNKQQITLAQPKKKFSYDGGCIPFDHPMKKEAFALAERVVESFTGLRGYIGVDLILSQDKIFVLDVNPRLTTSYVGLRQVVGFNVAQSLIDATTDEKLPEKPQLFGVSCFLKVTTSSPKRHAYQKTTRLSGVISPPFPISDYGEAAALIMGYGDTMQDAGMRLEEAKKQLLNIIC